MSVKKYFLAIVIPEPFFTKAETIKEKLFEEHGLKGALRSPAHITLHRPFIWKEEKEFLLTETLSKFKFETEFNVEFNNFSFFEPRVIYIDIKPNNALEKLHTQLTKFAKKELALFNEAEDLRGFNPHITIASRDLKKANFYELQPVFSAKEFGGIFNCANFSLLKLENKWEILKSFSFKTK